MQSQQHVPKFTILRFSVGRVKLELGIPGPAGPPPSPHFLTVTATLLDERRLCGGEGE